VACRHSHLSQRYSALGGTVDIIATLGDRSWKVA
jgi:hypothetical protein